MPNCAMCENGEKKIYKDSGICELGKPGRRWEKPKRKSK